MPIRPRHLSPGDTVGLVAPASAPLDPRAIDRAAGFLERLGFKVKLAPNVRKRRGYLAGTDRERAGDLMRMFTDPRITGIFCMRGGYGSARLLPLLNYGDIRAHPKIFVGFSDVTSLHCAFLTRANLISFHGPMLNLEPGEDGFTQFTRRSLLRTLSRPVPVSESLAMGETVLPGILRTRSFAAANIAEGYRGQTLKTLRDGVAHGQLIGGNLSLLCTTIGTPWQPPFRGRILFFEDVGEPPYRFDRMLTYLLNCGLLQQVAGIAIGVNHDCEDPPAKRAKETRPTLEEVLKERLLPLKIPVVTGLPFGHGRDNATLPVGARVTLDAGQGVLLIPQSVGA